MTGFKSIKQVVDELIVAGSRNYARMLAREPQIEGTCFRCGTELTSEVLSTDLDGNRREIVTVCPKCND